MASKQQICPSCAQPVFLRRGDALQVLVRSDTGQGVRIYRCKCSPSGFVSVMITPDEVAQMRAKGIEALVCMPDTSNGMDVVDRNKPLGPDEEAKHQANFGVNSTDAALSVALADLTKLYGAGVRASIGARRANT